MSIRYAFFAVLVFAAAGFSQTAIQPADWSAVNSMTLQTSGKTILFEMRDVSQSIRLSIVDLQGRAVWTRTAAPVDGVISVAWNGASEGRAMARGVYVMRAEALEGRRTALIERQFTFAP